MLEQPGFGKVHVRVRVSGTDPGDAKKRRGYLGSSMLLLRVVPRSDTPGSSTRWARKSTPAAWTAGPGLRRPVLPRLRHRRPSTVVPGQRAVRLPGHLDDGLGAS
ncbi:hypothetical protein [Streptomyces tauricus]